MLRETKNLRQISDEDFRRWFFDNYFDLIVWYKRNKEISGFQLCYAVGEDEKALTWSAKSGFSHDRIDSGDDYTKLCKMTPILVKDGQFEGLVIAERFKESSKSIEKDLSKFIQKKILEYTKFMEDRS